MKEPGYKAICYKPQAGTQQVLLLPYEPNSAGPNVDIFGLVIGLLFLLVIGVCFCMICGVSATCFTIMVTQLLTNLFAKNNQIKNIDSSDYHI